jgi:hypothetical protein
VEKVNENIRKIISGYCLGTITTAEFQKLKKWINKDIENKQIFDQYYSTYKKYKALGFTYNINLDQAWHKIKNQTSKKRIIPFRRILQYAAAILIPIGIAFTLYVLVSQNQSNYVQLSDAPIVKAGTKKATLFLANGKSINLKEDLTLKEKDGTLIKLSPEIIIYLKNENENKNVVLNTLFVPRKGEMDLFLSDGTRVWINSETTLIYPTKFTGNKREVILKSGEAFFEVAENPKKPFYVKTNGASIKVLGTAFNVKAYENENSIETTLVNGNVQLINENNIQTSSINLKPGYQAIIIRGKNKIVVNKVETRLFTSWKNGMFTFENLTLSEILTVFSRWYDLEVFYDDASLKNLHFTGNLKRHKNINPHLEVISLSTNVGFELTEKTILVYKK